MARAIKAKKGLKLSLNCQYLEIRAINKFTSKNKASLSKKIEIHHSMLSKELVKILEMHVIQFKNELFMSKSRTARDASVMIEKSERIVGLEKGVNLNQILIV